MTIGVHNTILMFLWNMKDLLGGFESAEIEMYFTKQRFSDASSIDRN